MSALAANFLAAVDPSPTQGSGTSSTSITDDPRSIIVTAITTAGIILVALISNRRANRTSASLPSPAITTSVKDDNETVSRLAVHEWRIEDLDNRVTALEDEQQKRRGSHRDV